jgi:hypothetical protein
MKRIFVDEKEYRKTYQEAFGFADELSASYKNISSIKEQEIDQMLFNFEDNRSGGENVRRFCNT